MIRSLGGHLRWLVRGRSSAAAVAQTALLQILTIVANIATGILSARLLAPTGRGEVAAINLIPTSLGLLLTFGVPSALLYNLKRYADDERELIGASLVAVFITGSIGIVAGYFVAPYMLHQYSNHVLELTRWFMLAVPLTLFMYVCASTFESRGDFWYANGTRFMAPLLTLAGLCAFAVTGRLDAFTAAASYLIPGVIIGAKMVIDVIIRYRPVFAPVQKRVYMQLGSYGLRSFGIDLLKTFGQQIDQILVIAFLSPAAMGLYAVSLAVSRILLLFQTSVVRVLLPRIAARPKEEVVSAVARATRITIALTIVPCVGLFVLAPFVLHLAYGEKFISAGSVVRVLAVEALLAGATAILAQAFLALGKPGTISALQGVGLLLSFPLMLVLIPRLGLLGAAIALLVSTAARLGLVIACFPWLLNTAAPRLLLMRGDIESVLDRLRRRSVARTDPVADS